RNTIRRWLREPSASEPKYARRISNSVVDPWSEQLRLWLVADTRRTRRERRSAKQMYEDLRAAGYDGSYDRVSAFVR
ncbi:IS21 family transposase, partial [Burkholderia sp. SIMBA_019]